MSNNNSNNKKAAHRYIALVYNQTYSKEIHPGAPPFSSTKGFRAIKVCIGAFAAFLRREASRLLWQQFWLLNFLSFCSLALSNCKWLFYIDSESSGRVHIYNNNNNLVFIMYSSFIYKYIQYIYTVYIHYIYIYIYSVYIHSIYTVSIQCIYSVSIHCIYTVYIYIYTLYILCVYIHCIYTVYIYCIYWEWCQSLHLSALVAVNLLSSSEPQSCSLQYVQSHAHWWGRSLCYISIHLTI